MEFEVTPEFLLFNRSDLHTLMHFGVLSLGPDDVRQQLPAVSHVYGLHAMRCGCQGLRVPLHTGHVCRQFQRTTQVT